MRRISACLSRCLPEHEVGREIAPQEAVDPPATVQTDAGSFFILRYWLPFTNHIFLTHGRFELDGCAESQRKTTHLNCLRNECVDVLELHCYPAPGGLSEAGVLK